jgi:23S rRNA pseudouridine2605 synthase
MKMRIHKYMAHAGIASRRAAEKMVEDGEVMVNGHQAKIGEIVDSEHDKITVGGKLAKLNSIHLYYLIHKPRQVVSTVKDPEGRRTVASLVPQGTRLYPVGRLDYESEGLMLLTNDGELAFHLTHPSFEVEKKYRVLVKGVMTDKSVGYLEAGVTIEGQKTAAAKVEIVEAQENNTWIDITIHEGRNRQIRKMCEAVGYPVLRLIRTNLGPWELGDLPSGKFRELSASEVPQFAG